MKLADVLLGQLMDVRSGFFLLENHRRNVNMKLFLSVLLLGISDAEGNFLDVNSGSVRMGKGIHYCLSRLFSHPQASFSYRCVSNPAAFPFL